MTVICIALAIAIVLIAGSVAYTIPEIPDKLVDGTEKIVEGGQPVAEGTSEMLFMFGIAAIIGVLAFSIVFGLIQSKKEKGKSDV